MKKICLFALILTLVSFNLVSQTDTLKNKELTEVVITGVRTDKNQPIPEITLNKDCIQKNYTGQDFQILAARTPAITWYSDGGNYNGYMYMRMRGIDQTRINFTMNGMPLAEPEDQGTYFSNYADFLSNIGSFQIQRGTGTSSNGNSSFVGSVNFESPNLTDSAWNEVNTGYGSFNSSRLSAGFNTGVMKSGFAVYGRYSNIYSNGYRNNSSTNANTFFTSLGYYGKKDIFKLTAFSGKSKNQMAYLATSLKDIDSLGARTNYLNPNERDDFNQQLVQFQHTRKTGQNSFLSSSLYYIGLQGQYGVLFTPSMYNFSLFSEMYGAMSTWAFIKNKFTFRVGANGYSYYRNHAMSIAPDISQELYSNRGQKNELSGFTKVSYGIGKLNLFADLQVRTVTFSYKPSTGYDLNVNPITWTFFNPKGGLNYQFNNKSSTFISVGQTHREPTRNDMFAGFDDMDTSNVALIGNLNKVKPEQVTDYEVGYRFSGKKLDLSTNVFFMQFKNEIAAIGQLSYIGLPLRKNVASSQRYGIELNYSYQLFKNFSLIGNATYMKANIDSYTSDFDSTTYKNITPLLTPEWIINQNLSYSFLNNKVDITAGVRYISTQYLANDNNNKLMVPEAFTVNGAITIKPIKRISVSLICNNITNERIFNSGYAVAGMPYYFIGAPRNWYATLSYKF